MEIIPLMWFPSNSGSHSEHCSKICFLHDFGRKYNMGVAPRMLQNAESCSENRPFTPPAFSQKLSDSQASKLRTQSSSKSGDDVVSMNISSSQPYICQGIRAFSRDTD